MKNITPTELKIIQSDVNYYIADKELIKENPVLKIKKLKEVFQEEEDEEEEFKLDHNLFGNKNHRRNNLVKRGSCNEKVVNSLRKSNAKKQGKVLLVEFDWVIIFFFFNF